MTDDYPAWLDDDQAPAPAITVDWSALPDDWRSWNWRLGRAGLDRPGHANLIRAQVAEGIADARALTFADHLEQTAA